MGQPQYGQKYTRHDQRISAVSVDNSMWYSTCMGRPLEGHEIRAGGRRGHSVSHKDGLAVAR